MIKTLLFIIKGSLGAGCIIALVYFSADWYFENFIHVKSKLPAHAKSTMQEYYVDAAPLPDYIYCFRAPLDENEFIAFVKSVGLKPVTQANKLHFPLDCKADWWTFTSPTYPEYQSVETTHEMGAMVIYKNGFIYYVAYNS